MTGLPTFKDTCPKFTEADKPDVAFQAWEKWAANGGALDDAREAIIAAIDQGLIAQGMFFERGALPGMTAEDFRDL